MMAGPTPICETIWEQAITTVAAPMSPNSAGDRRRPSAISARIWTSACTPVPEKVQNIPPMARWVSPRGAPAGPGSAGDWLTDLAGSVGYLVTMPREILAQEVVQQVLLRRREVIAPAIAVPDRRRLDPALELGGRRQLGELHRSLRRSPAAGGRSSRT